MGAGYHPNVLGSRQLASCILGLMADRHEASTSPAAFAIRPPTWTRVYFGLFMIVWAGLLVWIAVPLLRRGDPLLVGVVVMLLLGSLFVWRVAGVRAFVDGDRLIVRNTFRTVRFDRNAVDRVAVGKPSSSPMQVGRGIVLLDRDGGLTSIDASAVPAFTAQARNRLARQAEALENWRLGAGHRQG